MSSVTVSFVLGGCAGIVVMIILFMNMFAQYEKVIAQQGKKIKEQEEQNIKFAQTIEQIARERQENGI